MILALLVFFLEIIFRKKYISIWKFYLEKKTFFICPLLRVKFDIRKKKIPYRNPEKEISEALNNSDDKSFDIHLKNSKSVCIAICDITRPVPNKKILPILIKKICDMD